MNSLNSHLVHTNFYFLKISGESSESSRKPPAKRMNERRDKREKAFDNIRTRPSDLPTKQGDIGGVVSLLTNHYRLQPSREFKFVQYSIAFSPDGIGNELWPTPIKKHLVYQHKDFFGGYLYDGNNIYLTKKVPGGDTVIKQSETREAEQVQLTIRYVRDVDMTDDLVFQMLNIILRQGMRGLDLQLVGRNFYDPKSPVSF